MYKVKFSYLYYANQKKESGEITIDTLTDDKLEQREEASKSLANDNINAFKLEIESVEVI